MIEIVQFIAALAALIIIHELGHFLVAKFFKVEIEEFGLGFPPRVATLFEAGGTKFTLNWIPLGGFVRPKGENDPEVKGGLAAASPWVRLAVLFAGPFANLMAGVLLYAIIFTNMGSPITNQVQVMDVAENSPAQMAGVRPGDLILQVNDQVIDSTAALEREIRASLDTTTALVLQRNGEEINTSLVPRSQPPEGEGAIGIMMGHPTQPISFPVALPMGFVAVYDHSIAILSFPGQLIRGELSAEEGRIVGFKGMFDIYSEIRTGEVMPTIPVLVSVMMFFTTITISLGLLNLLPIPALDGGRILFTLPEIILRKRIPPHYENVINLVSFVLLILLLLYVNLQDFINPIELPR
ncbi:MAG: site-2 protease family protein [Anaerolineales bacterium]|nr:site-2 protease family protein [Anaerolineales bacterium]